jgi:alkanesulfonate monooxygenase SsuD/methylene tetrahydromethanopterin reductase-like flavin-dependent oxidoreductase (luciferase family)
MGLDPGVSEVTFHGKYYDIESAPVVTKTVQQPFIPWYATKTPDKARWCARLAMPMLALVPSQAVRVLTDAYREEWASLGRAEADLPPLGISRQIVIADTNEEAKAIASRAFGLFGVNISYLWHKFGIPMPPGVADGTFETAAESHRYAGDPPGARAWVAEHAKAAGATYFSLEFAFGDMTKEEIARSAELFATEVMPAFT